MERVIAYVDGYNLYYGLRHKQWKWFYWLNIQLLAEHLVKPDQKLVGTKYFTTIVNYPEGRHKRQAVFLEALQTLPKLQQFPFWKFLDMKFPPTDKKGLELSKFSHFSRNLAGFKEYDLHTPVHNGNCCQNLSFSMGIFLPRQ